MLYLAISLNALHLIKNFKLINQIKEPALISEQELADKNMTIADINK